MWDNKTGDYGAAICYNMAYEVSNTALMYEKTSVKLELQLLHTDYDCFYITGPGKFLVPQLEKERREGELTRNGGNRQPLLVPGRWWICQHCHLPR